MKKLFFVLMIFVLITGLFTGCEDDIREMMQKPPEANTSSQSASGEETSPQIETGAPAESAGGFITEEGAIEIALEKAGLTRNDVNYVKAEPDYDDRVSHYDVEFRQGKYEYDVEVKADDGTILSFEKDIDD